MDLSQLDIRNTLAAYRKREFKPSELVEAFLQSIEQQNPTINAFLEVRAEEAVNRAKELDGRYQEINKMPLYGIPMALKDNFLLKGWRTTAASKILENYVAPYTATCVEKLLSAGAIVIGKANLDEFAMGSSNENSGFGTVKNPWDVNRVPGGSSGGPAAAVAANLCVGALGTDTGGSIRQPAGLCGVVGMKPTYGRVSRYGVIAFGSSLDQVGPLCRSVADSAKILSAISGYDRKDATSSRGIVPHYSDHLLGASAKRFRIGLAKEWLKEGVDDDVLSRFQEVVDVLSGAGAKIVDVSLPHFRYALSTYYLVAPSEASSNLARYDGVHIGYRSKGAKSAEEVYSKSRGEGFGPEVKLRIMLGTYALSAGYYDAYYGKANEVRQLIQNDFLEAYKSCDCILMPTAPTTAFKFGEKSADPIKMYLSDIFTLPVNLAGLPAISVPCGLSSEKLPVGVQFIGKHFEESRMLQLAHAYEKLRGPFPSLGKEQ